MAITRVDQVLRAQQMPGRVEPDERLRGDGLELELGANFLRRVDERVGSWGSVAVSVPGQCDQARRELRGLDELRRLVLRVHRQTRNARRPDARRDECLDGLVVVGTEDEVERPAEGRLE